MRKPPISAQKKDRFVAGVFWDSVFIAFFPFWGYWLD